MNRLPGALLLLLTSALTYGQPGPDDIVSIVRPPSQSANQAALDKRNVHLSVDFVQLPEAEAEKLWAKSKTADRSPRQAWIIEMFQPETALPMDKWKTLPGAKLLTTINLTTRNSWTTELSRPAETSGTTQNVARQDRTSPAGSPVRAFLMVTPSCEETPPHVRMEITVGLTNAISPLAARTHTNKPADDAPGLAKSPKLSASLKVWDGQTAILGNPLDPKGEPCEKPGDGKPRLLVFVTPVIIEHDLDTSR